MRGSGHEITSWDEAESDPAKCVSLYQMFVANVNFGVPAGILIAGPLADIEGFIFLFTIAQAALRT
jgi:hypothetical protein